MRVAFAEKALDEYIDWQSEDKKTRLWQYLQKY